MQKTASDLIEAYHYAQARRPMSTIPTGLRLPNEGAAVLFWTRNRLEKDARSRANALEGVFEKGRFVVQTDTWSVNEVEAWAPAAEAKPAEKIPPARPRMA